MSVTGPKDRVIGQSPFSNARDLADRAPKSNDNVAQNVDVQNGQSHFVFAQGSAPTPAPTAPAGGSGLTAPNVPALLGAKKLGEPPLNYLQFKPDTTYTADERKWLDQRQGFGVKMLDELERLLNEDAVKSLPYFDKIENSVTAYLKDKRDGLNGVKKILSGEIPSSQDKPFLVVEPKPEEISDAKVLADAKIEFDGLQKKAFDEFALEFDAKALAQVEPQYDMLSRALGTLSGNMHPGFDEFQQRVKAFQKQAALDIKEGKRVFVDFPLELMIDTLKLQKDMAQAKIENIARNISIALHTKISNVYAAKALSDIVGTAPAAPPPASATPRAPADSAPAAPPAPPAPAPDMVAKFKERIQSAFEQSETTMNEIDEIVLKMNKNFSKIEGLKPANPNQITPLRKEAEQSLKQAIDKQIPAKVDLNIVDELSKFKNPTNADATQAESIKTKIEETENAIVPLADDIASALDKALKIMDDVQAQVDEFKPKADASSVEAGKKSAAIKNVGDELQRLRTSLENYKKQAPLSMKKNVDEADKLAKEIEKTLKTIDGNKAQLQRANSELDAIVLPDPAKKKAEEITRLSETIVKDAVSAEGLLEQAKGKLELVTTAMADASLKAPPAIPAIFMAVALEGGKKVVWKQMTEDPKAFVDPRTSKMVKGFVGEEGKTKISVNFESTQDPKSNEWKPLTMKIGNGAKKPIAVEKDQALLVYQQGGTWKSKGYSGTPNDFIQFAISEKLLKVPAKPAPRKSSYSSFGFDEMGVLRKPCEIQKQADGKTDIVLLDNNQNPPAAMGFGPFYQCPAISPNDKLSSIYQYAPLTSSADPKISTVSTVTASFDPWVWQSGADRLKPENHFAEQRLPNPIVGEPKQPTRFSYKDDVDFLNQLREKGYFPSEPDVFSTAVQLEKEAGGNYSAPARCETDKSPPVKFGPRDKKIEKATGHCKIADQTIAYESTREFKIEAVDKKDANQGTRFSASPWKTKIKLPDPKQKPIETELPAMTLARINDALVVSPQTPGAGLEEELQNLSSAAQNGTYYGKTWSLSVGVAMAPGSQKKVTTKTIDDPTLPADLRRSYESLLQPDVAKKDTSDFLLSASAMYQPDIAQQSGLSLIGELTAGKIGDQRLLDTKLGVHLNLNELAGLDLPFEPSASLLLPLPLNLTGNADSMFYDSLGTPQVNVCLKSADIFKNGVGLEGCVSFTPERKTTLAEGAGSITNSNSTIFSLRVAYDWLRGPRPIESK